MASLFLLPVAICLLTSLLGACRETSKSAQSAPDKAYLQEIDAWHAARHRRLNAAYGFLSLTALAWLEAGENSVGADPACEVVLPQDKVPERVGVIAFDGERAIFRAAPGTHVTLDGQEVRHVTLRDDSPGPADQLRVGDIKFYLIERGGRYAIRVKDPDAPERVAFHGVAAFPTDPAMRIEAHWQPYDAPREVEIVSAVGTIEKMWSTGFAEFTVNGNACSLEPSLASPDAEEYFFIFKDATSGETTYGAGRFLIAEAPQNDRIVLDFNRAFNPPCAFTAFATCPLPPPGNHLDVAIAAGEQAPHR